MTQRFEAAWAAWNGVPARRVLGLGRRRARRAGLRRRARARPCCARRTRSWPRRWPSCGRRLRWRSSTATATTSACPSRISRRKAELPPAAGRGARPHRRPSRLRDRADRRAIAATDGIFLLEDCAHAHGASWDGRSARAPSATRASSRSTPPRRSRRARVACWSPATPTCSSIARAFRNYGKPDHAVAGLNFRMSEFTAALGARPDRAPGGDRRVEERPSLASTSIRVHPDRLALPDGMVSGLYKYIVFDPIERSTGQGLRRALPPPHGHHDDLPNTDWVAENHWCVPLYYRPDGVA